MKLPLRLLLPLFACAGCAECAPGRVGEGAARLTVVSSAAMLRLIEADDRCGFESALAPRISGDPGSEGEVTWRVEGCRIARDAPEIRKSCTNESTTITGAVEITATKTVRGLLTGDPDQPVIPLDANAATIQVERASFDRFHVVRENAPGDLELISGELSFVAWPRLAADTSGACSVATPNARFEDMVYLDAKARITTPDRSFEVDLPSSNLFAAAGDPGDGSENLVGGAITVWNDDVELGTIPLDESYERARWIDGYRCEEELAQPIAFECPIEEALALGASRILVLTAGAILRATNANERCGFSSPDLPPEVDGPPLTEATLTLSTRACEIAPHESASCSGERTELGGSVVVDARRTVTGFRVGVPVILPLDLVIPQEPDAVDVHLDRAALAGAVLRTGEVEAVFTSGEMTALIHPVLAEDDGLIGTYSVPTPVAYFERVVVEGASLRIDRGGRSIAIEVERAELEALNGSFGGRSNFIRGEIVLRGSSFEIGSELDPDFDQAEFDASYACTDGLGSPVPTE
jgi:hypothetical protein